MTGKLMRAVGRRSQFLTSWASTGLHEYLHDVAADSQREKSTLIMGHTKYVSNLSNDPCLSVFLVAGKIYI